MVFQQIATYVVEALGLTGSLRAAAHFWIYDTLKILSILVVVIFGVTYLRTYFPPEKIRDYLEGKRAITGYALAALLGIVSPFCSCSTIPIFLGMVGAGIPFGITITFLAVSPMINEAALVVLPGRRRIQTDSSVCGEWDRNRDVQRLHPQ
ncbi:permease [Natrinema hispanicum]|uniref:permease n=1 Tax=Natrinema hispanicum TaxID=392421 RepID=UPI001A911797|nr:permease [Natrinema hispanicum]